VPGGGTYQLDPKSGRELVAELLPVYGPRIDPDEFPAVPGIRVAVYVRDLFRTLACCDLAVVPGGLSTTMELVANRRPFIYSGAPYRAAGSRRKSSARNDCAAGWLADEMRRRLHTAVAYAPVETGAALTAAKLIGQR
jgi:hypothetical protein